MIVTKLENGQIEVKHENLTLTQTNVSGFRHNECLVEHAEFSELVASHDERFKPLFIALHNFKYNL
jgi:hypothetical protein